MMQARILRIAVAFAALALFAAGAMAQRNSYRDRYDDYDRGYGNGRGQAGVFDYYLLALSWSPTYCAERRGTAYDQQCDVRQGRPYAFVLHGLWPQNERGWPE